MNLKSYVSRAFKQLPIPTKVIFGEKVITDTTTNAATFVTPKVPIATLQKVNDNLKATAAAAQKGGTAATANMRAAEKVWNATFEEHAAYVDSIANGDETIIGQSGFDATASESIPADIPGDVKIKDIKTNQASGSIHVVVNVASEAMGYMYIVSSDATVPVITDGVISIAANPKLVAVMTDTHRTVDIKNLPAKSTVYITIAAFNHVGIGNLSAPVAVGTL